MLNKWITILIALFIGSAVACSAVADEPTATPIPTVVVSTPTPQVNTDVRQTELDLNRNLWESKAIGRYHFEHRWICFCPQEYVALVDLSVQDGAIVDIKFAEGSSGGGEPDIAQYNTVAGLFDIIQDAIDTKAYKITVEYETEFGYPTEVYIDYDMRIADEEMGFMAANLQTE